MKTQKPLVWSLLSAALFGAPTPALKHLLANVSPLLLAGLLYAGAAVALASGSLAGWRRFAEADRSSWIRLLAAVLFGDVIGPALLVSHEHEHRPDLHHRHDHED